MVASMQSQLDNCQQEKLTLRERLIESQYEVTRLKAVPSRVQVTTLELKLNDLEARHARREASLRDALAMLELQSEQQARSSVLQYETVLRQKNSQICEFKAELDGLLTALAALQKQQ
eukprot:CRZ06075.1 hypothetical protein [Spongospora subterranea]